MGQYGEYRVDGVTHAAAKRAEEQLLPGDDAHRAFRRDKLHEEPHTGEHRGQPTAKRKSHGALPRANRKSRGS